MVSKIVFLISLPSPLIINGSYSFCEIFASINKGLRGKCGSCPGLKELQVSDKFAAIKVEINVLYFPGTAERAQVRVIFEDI